MRKISFSLAVLSIVMVVGWLSKPAHAALLPGNLVKGPNSDAVYLIDGMQKKRVFPDRKTYMTWYTDFNAVKLVPVAELDMYPDGKPMPFRSGTKLITHPNTARVYAVEYDGNIRWIPSEQCATTLYGSNWAKLVQDVQETTFGSVYSVGSDVDCIHHPKGTLLQKKNDPTIYYVGLMKCGVTDTDPCFGGPTTIRPFANIATFDEVYLLRENIIIVDSLDQYTIGPSITPGEKLDLPYDLLYE